MLCACGATAANAAGSPTRKPVERPIYVTAIAGPNMLGTTAVSIRADRFSGSLSQALQDASQSPALQRMIAPARQLTPLQQVAYVQSRVHASIRWISDATEWGQHDYWASATQTLARGAGDMEDRAILMMHALRALGFRPGDLFLTLARDRVGGPLTVLAARVNGRYLILDDTGGAPFPVDARRNEFQPILSFGWTGAWVHTRPLVAPAVRVAGAPVTRK